MSTEPSSTPAARKWPDPVSVHLADPKSLRKAINAHCWDCVGGKADSQNPRRLVRECEIVHCNLHPVRPWQMAAADEPAEETETDLEDTEELDK